MGKFKKRAADVIYFSIKEDFSSFVLFCVFHILLILLVCAEPLSEGLIKNNIRACLDFQSENVACVYDISENDDSFFQLPIIKKDIESGRAYENSIDASFFTVLFDEESSGPTSMVYFSNFFENFKEAWGVSLEGTFEGAVVDEATFERKDLNLGSSKIDVVCGGDVIKSIPITGVCHKIDTPHFLSPVKRHDLIEDSVLLPSSFYADFHGLPGSYWSKDVVLRYQQPLDYEYSVLLKSAADKYELSTKAMVVSDELSKLDKTLFAFFRVSETIVLAFAMFAEVQITVSSLQKKEKGVLTRYFCGMDLFASFSYSLFYCLLSFCVSLLISVLSNILLSIVFTKFLNGKLIGPFFGEFYWQVGVFIAFSIASFITVSAVFSKKTSLLLSD